MGRKQIELLIEAGAFDFTGWSRDAMRESLEAMWEEATRAQKESELGVMDLFSLFEAPAARFESPPQVSAPSSKMALLQREKELLGFYLTGHPMDSCRAALGRLSCVPFKEFERMPDGTIVRTAFVVETVQIKISAKSQRKFAILTISDGIERYELPVWSDLFEEKGMFLRENQMLYGIVAIEKQGGEAVHLQAKFLDDLTAVDESKIKAFDDFYDRLKSQAKPMNRSNDKGKKVQPKQPQAPEAAGQLHIRVDADDFRLTQVLTLKQIFRDHPGKSNVKILFESEGKPVGSLQIESPWGIDLQAGLIAKLEQIEGLSWERRD